MEKRRVVITGLGTVNPAGNNVQDSWQAVRAGRCAVGPITAFDASENSVALAAEVKGFDPSGVIARQEVRKTARFVQFALCAAAEALADSGLDACLSAEEKTRFATVISSGIGGLPVIEREHARGEISGFERVSPHFIPMAIANMAAGEVAIYHGLRGLCTCPTTACAGGTNAIGDAFRLVRDGYEDYAVAGGTESCVSPLGLGGFASMKALSTARDPARASLPFDAGRGGFVLGEGCGLVVLETLEHAVGRGAHIYAELAGYGTSCDAHHVTAPAPGGEGGARCFAAALRDAALPPESVDYINAHGTGTSLNDVCETQAIKAAFGAHAYKLLISSTKSVTGHLLGGAGGVEAVFTALALQDGFAPPTVGLTQPDPDCDLDYVPGQGRPAALRVAVSDSLGFGGHNAALVFKKWEG